MLKDRAYREKKFWSRFAAHYDSFMAKQISSYQILIEKTLAEIKGDWVVLEVAAGTGLITLKVAQKARKVIAIDITPEMIAQAEQKAKEEGKNNIEFSVEDAYHLPYAHDMFDAVICSNALHNMKQPEQALSEMRRVLKTTGILITPTFCHGEGLKSRIISLLMAMTGFPAYHRFTQKQLSALIEESGFKIEKEETIKDKIPMAFIVSRKRQ